MELGWPVPITSVEKDPGFDMKGPDACGGKVRRPNVRGLATIPPGEVVDLGMKEGTTEADHPQTRVGSGNP